MNRRTVHSHGEPPPRSLAYDEGVEPGYNGPHADVADPLAGAVRRCAEMCTNCIFRPGNPLHLQPGRATAMVTEARAREGQQGLTARREPPPTRADPVLVRRQLA